MPFWLKRRRKDMTHLGKLLWNSRFEKGLTLGEIAQGLGYSLSKGTRKYLEWERENKCPGKEELDRLIQVMKLNPKQVQKAVERDRRDYEKWWKKTYKTQKCGKAEIKQACIGPRGIFGYVRVGEEWLGWGYTYIHEKKDWGIREHSGPIPEELKQEIIRHIERAFTEND
jgi:hypothetical protein